MAISRVTPTGFLQQTGTTSRVSPAGFNQETVAAGGAVIPVLQQNMRGNFNQQSGRFING